MRNRLVVIALHSVLPIAIGGLIYVAWRSPLLLMFSWFDGIGLSRSVAGLREAAANSRPLIPQWALFSLPDGLWVYAVTAFMTVVWHGADDRRSAAAWIAVGALVAVGSEIGQLVGIVPGTFDPIDVLTYSGAAVLAVVAARRTLGTPPTPQLL